jgi:hypothetical protein
MNEELTNAWKKAVADCGGVERFERDVLPLCSESTKTIWAVVKAEVTRGPG